MQPQPIFVENMGAPFTVRSRQGSTPSIKWHQDLKQTSTAVVVVSPPEMSSTTESLSQAMLRANSTEVVIKMYGIDIRTPESRTSSQVVTEIDRLKAGKEDEVIPTDYAYEQARRTVEAAYAAIKPLGAVPSVQPEPWATTDDVGGIRLLWDVGSKKLRANFAARPGLRTYLYHESAFEHDAEPLNIQTLTGRLTWLTER